MINMTQIDSISFGSITYPVGGTFGPRIQNSWQLVFLHTGGVTIDLGGLAGQALRQIQVEAGEVCLLQPGYREYFQFSRRCQTWHRWISLLPAPDAGFRQWLLPQDRQTIRIPPALNQMMDTMLQMRLAGLPQDHSSQKAMALAALDYMADAAARATESGVSHPALDRVMSFIRQFYGTPLGRADLARAAGLSREYLVRLVRQVSGQTPMQLVWSYRIEQGIELLKHSGLTVYDIAGRCGFAASQHFTRMVHQRTGMTPTQIRRQSFSPVQEDDPPSRL